MEPDKKLETLAEVERYRQRLSLKKFVPTDFDPIVMAFQRNQFELERVGRLLDVSSEIEGSYMERLRKGWTTKLKRLKAADERYRKNWESRKSPRDIYLLISSLSWNSPLELLILI